MKKKQFIFSFLVVACLIDVFDVNRLSAQNSFDNYITISNGHFQEGNNAFYPVCINYLVDYAQCIYDECNGEYYIAPLFNYSDTGSGHKETKINDILYNWHWCYGTNGQDEMNNARTKLNRDLERIDSLGFNVVRLRPMIYWKNDSLRIPTRSYAKYFELTDTLIAQCARNNLRVIMVLSDDTNTYKQFDQYCVYLDSVTRHYSTNKTVMAYVVYMEPSWKWKHAHVNDKIMISNWSRKWYYLIKKNAPNQLVTYGLDGLNNLPDPWQYFWTNMGSGYIGNWYIVTGDVILPGNFSDSTYASLICIRNQSQTKSLLQRFQTSSWSWSQIWSNNSYVGSWLLSSVDKYYVGDFSGDGIDELLCVQVTGGSSDWMKLIQKENAWTTLWTNNGQSGNAGISPYRGLLHVGNFGQDSADELLGIGSWATKFDLNTSNEWDWSWSTYESARLSDWSVNPNCRIFFMKTITDVPDYLFVGGMV